MRHVCVINNFNYAKYLTECLTSVRQQTKPFDLVVLVDDGSTDNSLEIARGFAVGWEQLHIIAKPNGGQLSCFNAAATLIDKNDLVCMLDADDVYPADYLECLAAEVAKTSAEFFFCEPAEFHTGEQPIKASWAVGEQAESFTWDVSSHATRQWQLWVGSPTSCVSLRGKLYLELLPYPYELDWRTRADDILVWGAGLSGAAKHHILSLRVAYRIHDNNAFARKVFSDAYKIKRAMHVDRLFNHYCEKFLITRTPPDLKSWARKEALLVPDRLWERYHLPDKRKLYLERYKGAERQLKKLQWILQRPV